MSGSSQILLGGNQLEPRRVLEDMLDLSKVNTHQTNLSAQTDSEADEMEQRENEMSILARDGHIIQTPNNNDITIDAGFGKHGHLQNPRLLANTVSNRNHVNLFQKEVDQSELTPMESPVLLQTPIRSADGSDGENVIQDEGEL